MKAQIWGGLLTTAVVMSLVSSPVGAAPADPHSAAPPAAVHTSPVGSALSDPSFGPAQRAAAIQAARSDAGKVAKELRLSAGESLKVRDVVRDADGTVHTRYDRTYKGLPVIGGDLIVHRSANGVANEVDWGTKADLSALKSTRASVSSASALAQARRTTGLAKSVESPSLAVWAVGRTARLAWKTVVQGISGGSLARDVVYVDAGSGNRIADWSELETTDTTGTGQTLYSGDVTIHTDDINGPPPGPVYAMRDLTRGSHRVTDMNDQSAGNGTLFTDADNDWGNNQETSRQSAAADAQYGAAATWDFYDNELNRTGIRNDGVGALSRVHFDDGGAPGYDNAFWNDDCFCMTYGDGQSFFDPLVSLDVAGHEMTHGVTSNTANLHYFGESGGLNEATSDIFGTMVEFRAANAVDTGDYYIGEEIVPGPPGFLRRMDRPHADGDGYNCYETRMGRDDVHFTSGPANRFFYLLSEGTGSKTIGGLPHQGNTCNGTTIGGIGKGPAAQIWYRALNVYMTAGSDYRSARDATIRAARDLYGPTSPRCARVVRTWLGVNVGQGLWACSGRLAGGGANLLSNGGFESGSANWTAPAGVIITNPPLARTGDWFAYLNGFGSSNTQTVRHAVTLPNAQSIQLSFYLLIDSFEGDSGAFDTLAVRVKRAGAPAVTLATFDNRQWDLSYHRRTANLSQFRGKTISLRFVGTEDNSLQTGFLIDDVGIRRN